MNGEYHEAQNMFLNRIRRILYKCVFLVSVIAIFWLGQGCNVSESPTVNLIPVGFGSHISGKWGFINKSGEMVIEPQFARANSFSKGLAAVCYGSFVSGDQKCGFIDESGRLVIPAQFNDAISFSDGLALVKLGNKCGYIDKTGIMVIETSNEFMYNGPFSEGLAKIRVGYRKNGYIDKKGNIVIPPVFADAGRFSEGLALVMGENNKYGYIDKGGKMTITPQFDYAAPFSGGFAWVQLRVGDGYGCIDRTGRIVIRPQFNNYRWRFSDGLSAVQKGNKWGFIDKSGGLIIGLQFAETMDFIGGIAAVRVGKRWGFIDKKGNMVIQPKFDMVELEIFPDHWSR